METAVAVVATREARVFGEPLMRGDLNGERKGF